MLDTNDAAALDRAVQALRAKARLWGVHSYKDPNNGTTWHTRQLMRMVKGEVWLTETGGIKRLKPLPGSRGNGRFNTLHGQAVAVKRVYALANAYPTADQADLLLPVAAGPEGALGSAFVDRKGKVRPAYTALRKGR